MSYRLIYDAAATSTAPQSALIFGAAALVLTLAWAGWLRYRAQRLHAGVKFLGVIALILFALSAGNRLEQRWTGGRMPQVVEGAITGCWGSGTASRFPA